MSEAHDRALGALQILQRAMDEMPLTYFGTPEVSLGNLMQHSVSNLVKQVDRHRRGMALLAEQQAEAERDA